MCACYAQRWARIRCSLFQPPDEVRMSNWQLLDALLCLVDTSDCITVPSAGAIYGCVFGDNPAGLPALPSRDSIVGQLSFSKRPLDLSIHVSTHGDAEDRVPCCVVVAEDVRGQTSVRIQDVMEREADHVVVNNTWYPFARGALAEVRELLKEVGVSPSGRLGLRQYWELRQLAEHNPFVRHLTADEGDSIALSLRPQREHEIQLNGKLYQYQQRGVNWLLALADEQLGGILADEMGLGKTVQIIALIASHPEAVPALIVAPATLLENWRREFNRFAPWLSTEVHHGPHRTGFPQELGRANVVVTSYGTLVRDSSLFGMIPWGVAALDEAQNIRNPDSHRARSVKGLRRRTSVAVTGTPVENRLEDLWSLADYAVPGLLGSRQQFLDRYEDTPADAQRIAGIAGPFILRRRVSQVAEDLPPRIDVPQALELAEWMVREYEAIRRQTLDKYGAGASFVALGRLRQFCTHPHLLLERDGDPAAANPKYTRLIEILEEVFENAEKALVFTSYTGMIDILVKDLPRRLDVSCDFIDGRVDPKDRQVRVDRFAARPGAAILVLNPQAAGTGLNIAAANHVVHYNPEWNPATQDQASARAHRRGQTRPVTVHQLYYLECVEEVIVERLARKREVAEHAVPTDAAAADRADVLRALESSPSLQEQ